MVLEGVTMAADNTTNKIKFDISELKAGITESNRLIKLANSEFKAAASGMDDWQNSTEGLEAKIKQLNTVQEQEQKKLDALKEQYKLVAEEQGENSAGAIKLATQINNQQAAVNKVTSELNQYEGRLDTVKTAQANAEKSGRSLEDELKDLENAAEDAGDAAEESGDGFTIMKGTLADLASNAIQWAISSIGDLASALFELPEATKEFRTVLAGVEQSASDSVIGIDGARKAYEDFYAIAADEGQAAEASNHIAGLVSSQEELQGALDGVIGAWVEFGDSIAIEGLAEAANETAKTGKVTGQMADALNWANASAKDWEQALGGNKKALDAFKSATDAGMTAEDAYNEALAACTTEQERQQLTVATLNGLYGENTKQYKENNKSLVDANTANLNLMEAQSNLATSIEPLTAAWTNLKAQALDAIAPALEWIGEKISELITYFQEHETAAAALKGVLIGLATALGILAGAFAIVNIINAVRKAMSLLNLTMLGNPIVLIAAAIAGLVAAFIYLWNTSEGFRNFWIGLWNGIVSIFNSAKEGVISGFNAIKTFFTQTIPEAFGKIIDFFRNNWKTILLLILNPFAGAITLLYQKSEGFRKIVDTIVNFFKQLPGKIWNAIVGAVTKLATWGSKMKEKATQAAQKVLTAIVNGLKKIPSKVLSIGGDVVKGLWNGISNKVAWLKSKISGFVGNVKNWLKKFFKIGSPSKLMADEIGRWIPEGIAVGITANAKSALKAMRALGTDLIGETQLNSLNVPALSGAASIAGGAVTNNYVFNQTNNSPTALSRLDIYRQTQNQLKQLKRIK